METGDKLPHLWEKNCCRIWRNNEVSFILYLSVLWRQTDFLIWFDGLLHKRGFLRFLLLKLTHFANTLANAGKKYTLFTFPQRTGLDKHCLWVSLWCCWYRCSRCCCCSRFWLVDLSSTSQSFGQYITIKNVSWGFCKLPASWKKTKKEHQPCTRTFSAWVHKQKTTNQNVTCLCLLTTPSKLF